MSIIKHVGMLSEQRWNIAFYITLDTDALFEMLTTYFKCSVTNQYQSWMWSHSVSMKPFNSISLDLWIRAQNDSRLEHVKDSLCAPSTFQQSTRRSHLYGTAFSQQGEKGELSAQGNLSRHSHDSGLMFSCQLMLRDVACIVWLKRKDVIRLIAWTQLDERDPTVMSSPSNSPSLILSVFVAPGESCPLSFAFWNSSFIMQLCTACFLLSWSLFRLLLPNTNPLSYKLGCSL